MIALIDTIFGPITNWLSQIITFLNSATIPKSYTFQLSNLFAPLAMISPAWSLLITNIFIMAVTYTVIFIVINTAGLFEKFKNLIKWW